MVIDSYNISDASECQDENSYNHDKILVCRGPWLEHKLVYCKVEDIDVFHMSKNHHCYCETDFEQKIFGSDNITMNYEGTLHKLNELEIINEFDLWVNYIINKVKKNPKLTPEDELIWSSLLYNGNLTNLQFQLDKNPIQNIIPFTAKLELCSTFEEFKKIRKILIENLMKIESLYPPKLVAIIRRQMYEYICARTFLRVTKSPLFNEILHFVNNVKDSLLKHILGGGWVGTCYVTFEFCNIKKSETCLEDAIWIDTVGCLSNNWASLHRDLKDGTKNNAVFYYKDSNFSMSEDLYSVIYESLYNSGYTVRANLVALDLCDHNLRYKFSENYFHCMAKSYDSLQKKTNVKHRLEIIYGSCSFEENTNYDIYCYCLTRDLHENSINYKKRDSPQNPSEAILFYALKDCIGIEKTEIYYSKLISEIKSAVNLQEKSFHAGLNKNHDDIAKHCYEYRQLRMKHWSYELNSDLPIGANLIITYHVFQWFLDNMCNVDKGYKLLAESEFTF